MGRPKHLICKGYDTVLCAPCVGSQPLKGLKFESHLTSGSSSEMQLPAGKNARAGSFGASGMYDTVSLVAGCL